MKELKFKTSKGEFLVVDDVNGIGRKIPYDLVTKIGYIKNLTEEQASEIFRGENIEHTHLKDYNKQKLINVLKSKGIHLFENPYPDAGLIPSYEQKLYREAEEKTFYNPYIFKL